MPVDQSLLQYYSDLLIAQYKDAPKMVATTKLLANQSLCDGLPQELRDCFDLSKAIGNQLTILGEIVGVPRNIFGLDLTNTFFNYTDYATGTTSAIGFGSYTTSPYSASLFRSYFDSATYALTDYQLQQLIYLKILYNNTYSSTKNIVEGLWGLFGSSVQFIDNSNTSAFTPDILIDGGFEMWNNPTQLTNWGNPDGSVAQTTSPVFDGTYSAGVTSGFIYQLYPGYTSTLGQTVKFEAWVWCASAGQAYIEIIDGVSSATSSFHPGDSQWHKLTVSYVVSPSATKLELVCAVTSGVAYFDLADAVYSAGFTVMNVTYNVLEPYHTVFTVAQYLNILLRPMGVNATLNLI